MQATCCLDDITSGPKVEMESICKNKFDRVNLISNIFRILQKIQNQTFDRSFGSHGHKNRRFERDAIERDLSDSRIPLLLEDFEVEF